MSTTDAVITCINSALYDCEFKLRYPIKNLECLKQTLRFMLSKLTMFVVICGRKLESDASFLSFLTRIEDTVRRNTARIHFTKKTKHIFSRWMVGEEVLGGIEKFIGDIKSLEEEIDEWYVKVLDNLHTRQSTADEVLEIITSVFQNLLDFRRTARSIDYLEMEQEILFMKCLLDFVSKRCVVQVEPLKDLLAHIHFVTTNLAHLFFRSVKTLEQEDRKQLRTDFHDYEIYTRALISSSKLETPLLASTDMFATIEDFLDSLISDLWDILRLDTYSCSSSSVSFKDDLKELYGELRSLRDLVKHHHQLQRTKTKDDIGKVVCDAGVFICSLHQMKHTDDENLVLLQNLLNTLKTILVESGAEQQPEVIDDQFSNEADEYVPVANKEENSNIHIMPSQGDQGAEPVAVGFHDDQILIVDRLKRGSRKLQIVAFVGMPGIGKTTLATRVYTNPSVLDYFSVRGWTTVSQVVDEKKVLLDLLNQIDPTKCSEMSGKPQLDIADGLRKSLKGRKYLIFLDDMWDTEAWHSLKASFPDDNIGSRIILTSRRHDVVPHDLMVDRKPHSLRLLNEEESVELFQNNLSSGNGSPPPLSLDLRVKIAEKCRGLPLTIVILAGVLKSIEPEEWNAILDGMLRNDHMHYRNTLELSYIHLPPYLRPCFLYFGSFKEDEEVSVRRLLRLWIAEGFVQIDNTTKSLEEAAETYLRDLIGRSLIMVAKEKWDGGVKACRIHDLLHEFCIQKAKDEHLFHFVEGYDELSAFKEPHTLQRLCIQSEAVQHFTQSRLFCPRTRSLLYRSSQSSQSYQSLQNSRGEGLTWIDISPTIHISKHLAVLDLEKVHLGFSIPSEIGQLVQLAFLAIRCSGIKIPSFIGNLLNLETFILQYNDKFPAQLPDSLWNLEKLRYLYISDDSGGYLPENNLESSPTLDELDRISGVNIDYSKMKSVLRKIRNARRLKCMVSCKNDVGQNPVVDQLNFEILRRLESLNLSVNYSLPDGFGLFILPATLKKLTLREVVNLSWRNLSTIGELPKLEVLELLKVQLEGETWEMKEGEFPRLRILKLVNSKLVNWLTNCDDDDDQLCYFEKLELGVCHNLEELPDCLDIIPTLNIIEVSGCYTKQVDLVRQIKKRRELKMGDSSLKIITSNTMDDELYSED